MDSRNSLSETSLSLLASTCVSTANGDLVAESRDLGQVPGAGRSHLGQQVVPHARPFQLRLLGVVVRVFCVDLLQL